MLGVTGHESRQTTGRILQGTEEEWSISLCEKCSMEVCRVVLSHTTTEEEGVCCELAALCGEDGRET